MNDILKFEGHEVRSAVIDNEVYFVAKDVFQALGIVWKRSQSLNLIPNLWKREHQISTPSGNQVGHVINFKAVSKIAFRSNKPEADEFTNKASEIVDSVARTGKFSLTEPEDELDILESAIKTLKQVRRESREVKVLAEENKANVEKLEYRQTDLQNSLRINEYECKVLTDLVKNIVSISPNLDFATVWRTFKDRFSLASYRGLPRNRFQEGKGFLEQWYKSQSTDVVVERPKGLFSSTLIRNGRYD